MRNELTFNGTNFSTFSAYIATSNFMDGASKDMESVIVLGRSGELLINNNRYNNITLKVLVYVTQNMKTNMDAMRHYLESCHGYKTYSETLTSGEYRMASFSNMFVPDVYDNNSGTVVLEFNCMPQRWLKSGETPVSVSSTPQTYTGNPISIDNPSGISAVSSLAVALNPVQAGSGDPSPTNIRPISGRSTVTVERTGVNQFDEIWESGSIASANGQNTDNTTVIRAKNYIPVYPNTQYYLSNAYGSNIYWFFYDADKNYLNSYGNGNYDTDDIAQQGS